MRQTDLAKRVRVTQETVSRIERDRAGFDVFTFIQIGIVFGVSLDYLAHGDTANADQSNYGSIAGAPTAATGGKSSSVRWRKRAD
jgi:transcriptional regulator with XRE-family HTH domain